MATAEATESPSSSQLSVKAPQLEVLDHSKAHAFALPVKRIQDGQHVTDFLSSRAYQQVMTFLFQLNEAMYPRSTEASDDSEGGIQTWELGSSKLDFSEPVLQIAKLLQKLEDMVDDFPPDPGPRRFGNVSFRRWSEAVESRLSGLLEDYLPADVLTFPADTSVGVSAQEELSSYFLGSFGSSQRLDYGTGHELSFLAFLGCLWMLGGFSRKDPGVEERAIVLGVIEPYLHLVRRLIQTYLLEPAGSHGVWGLDDHSFLPYIFGSAQFCPPISSLGQLPAEGSYPGAANPADVAKASVVAKERKCNMYFAAIGFIYDVKKGPFWEHSPILYDISGVKAGWAKINKGMIKMYNAEVLSKFPVVQHFPFGSLFSWERDPNAPPASETSGSHTQTLHIASHPPSKGPLPSDTTAIGPGPSPSPRIMPPSSSQLSGTKAPWASTGTGTASPRMETGATAAPWAGARSAAVGAPAGTGAVPVTRAPWAMAATNRPRAPPPASWGPKTPATTMVEPKK